jgi:hypothetical protein
MKTSGAVDRRVSLQLPSSFFARGNLAFAPTTDRTAPSRLRAQIHRTTALSGRRSDVGVHDIVAFEQQRFTCELCERIGKAIAEIQLGRMAAPLPKSR